MKSQYGEWLIHTYVIYANMLLPTVYLSVCAVCKSERRKKAGLRGKDKLSLSACVCVYFVL